jgi:hypothetical protein
MPSASLNGPSADPLEEVLAELLENFDRATCRLDPSEPWRGRLLRLRAAIELEVDLPSVSAKRLESIPTISGQAVAARRRKHLKGGES